MNNVKEVGLKEIKPSKFNPRKHFDKDKLQDLVNSIKEKGVIEPIIVRPANGKYEVVCGERRLRASEQAGLKTIPAIVRELDDKQALEFQVIENLQREDLDPIDEAVGFKTMLEKCRYTQADLSTRVGKSHVYITNRMKLLDLPEDIQGAISSQIITPGHGVVLLRLKDPKDQKGLFKAITQEKLSIRAAENALDGCGAQLSSAIFDATECKECPSNGAQQLDLFDKDTKLKDRCLNLECFRSKHAASIEHEATRLKKQGHMVVAEKTIHTKKQVANYSVVNMSDHEDFYKRNKLVLGKFYKEKCCGGCQNHYFVLTAITYGELAGLKRIEEWCINSKCHTALANSNSKKSKKSEESSAEDSYKKDLAKRKSEERALEAKRRFWKVKVSHNASDRMLDAAILHFLLAKLEPYGTEDIVSGYEPWEAPIKFIYALGPEEVKVKIVAAFIKLIECALDDEDLEFLTTELKFDLKKDFLIDEPYLQAMTKEQIIALAKEIGLDKYLKKNEICEPGKLLSKPKSMLIAYFFKNGFDLTGKTPKEIML